MSGARFDRFFGLTFHGEPFVLFGVRHGIAVGIVLALAATLLLPRRLWTMRLRRTVRFGLAGGLFILELARHVWFAAYGVWDARIMLPLNLCSISVWLSIAALLARSRKAYEPLYFLGLGGATQGLITPNVADYSFPHFLAVQSFASHAAIVLATLYLTRIERFRPTPRSLRDVIVWVGGFAPAVFLLNLAIGSNYLFLAEKPAFPTAMDTMPPWPWYIPVLAALALLVALALYAPFWVADLRARRAATSGSVTVPLES